MTKTNQPNKTHPTQASVKSFLAGIADINQRDDAQRLCWLITEVTGRKPAMWGASIVGFGTFHYKYASGREGDTVMIGFSPRKSNLTIYLLDGADKHTDALAKLGPHKMGKGCLYIKRLSDINIDVLTSILTASYKFAQTSKDGFLGVD